MTVTSSVFCSIKHVFIFIPISSGSENSSKRTKNGLLSCHSYNTCVIRTECSTHHRFRLINVLHCFFRAERSPGRRKTVFFFDLKVVSQPDIFLVHFVIFICSQEILKMHLNSVAFHKKKIYIYICNNLIIFDSIDNIFKITLQNKLKNNVLNYYPLILLIIIIFSVTLLHFTLMTIGKKYFYFRCIEVIVCIWIALSVLKCLSTTYVTSPISLVLNLCLYYIEFYFCFTSNFF